ncbi:MAG: bifunctional hydroxymethylpyrimidine kinase/phosphomethylpyrimidine kinase [Actinomycetota bacterium]
MKIPTALTIAGSDSGGGAGIQADLKTFLALGVHGTSAISALTAQNTKGVSAVHDVPPAFVAEQIKQVAIDFDVASAKTGMLSNAAVVEAVADALARYELPNIVVDPVFVSKNHDRLLSEDGVDAIAERLFPLATVVTPNLEEASGFSGMDVHGLRQMREAARFLHGMGPRYVLVKGGHLAEDAVDVLFDGSRFLEFRAPRHPSRNTHGTGCTLSAAIAAFLARGLPVPEAVEGAKAYVTGAIAHGLDVGKGFGPTNHGWQSSMAGGATSG